MATAGSSAAQSNAVAERAANPELRQRPLRSASHLRDVEFRLQLCDALELHFACPRELIDCRFQTVASLDFGIRNSSQFVHCVAQGVQNDIALVEDVDDAVVFSARHIHPSQW
jgi:hypothetical protein